MRERPCNHIVIIMFENEYRGYVMANNYMRALAAQGITMANYFGVMHPSHTNYLASLAGEICGATADPLYQSLMPSAPPTTPPLPLGQKTLPDLLSACGISWKAYMDGYYTVDYPPQTAVVMQNPNDPQDHNINGPATVQHTILDYPPYLNMHNPFVRFQSILGSPEKWHQIDTVYRFLADVTNGTLPAYSWLSPNLWNNGHWLRGSYSEGDEPVPGIAAFDRAPVLVDQLARWLETFFKILCFPGPHTLLPPRTLVVVTLDESDFKADYTKSFQYQNSYDGPNQIYTVLLGDMIKPGGVEQQGYNRYSLLKTVEKNFGLGNLGTNDKAANWFQFLWDKKFQWSAPQETPIVAADGVLAAEGFQNTLFVVYGEGSGALGYATYDVESYAWSGGQPVPAQASAVELAAYRNELLLFGKTDAGLTMLTYDDKSGWSTPQQIVNGAVGSFASATFVDYSDNVDKLVLTYSMADNTIHAMIYANGGWSGPVDINHTTAGDMAIAVLGPSLYLIYKSAVQDGESFMSVVSYNTAQFNTVEGTQNGSDDTTINTWSPSVFPVAHFGRGPSRSASESELEPILKPYPYGAPLAAATLDGVIHLAHPGTHNPQVLTETFSLSGIMTPKNQVDYHSSASNVSNGYGTLAEAGWSIQEQLHDSTVHNSGGLSMCSVSSRLALIFQLEARQHARICIGAYVSAV